MNAKQLIIELSNFIDLNLAKDLVSEFITIRNDCKTGTFGRGAVGKFIETVVQFLQFLENGTYEKNPKVDSFLKNLESRNTSIDNDLRILFSRIARATYTLRNKRNIAHKGSVDPNIYDLRFIYSSVQWILSEIVRHVLRTDMVTAGEIIEFIQIPVSSIIEEIDDRKIIFGDLTVDQEILVLLYSYYPKPIKRISIRNSLDRRANSSISSSLSKLWKNKLIHRKNNEYKITQEGFKKSIEILKNL